MWHGYFVVERQDIGSGNWADLQTLFVDMGTHDSKFPAQNTHTRTRLDGDAVIYESLFDPEEVSIEQFKELLAEAFGVEVEDIQHTIDSDNYAGWGTTVWEFLYNALARFTVRRFGQGLKWSKSGDECRGYLAQYSDEWEEIV